MSIVAQRRAREQPEHVTLGPFTVGAVIGAGGMGRVHAGVHARTGLPVAIKVVTSERAASPAALRRFGDEIRAMARLDHGHVIRILDVGELTVDQATDLALIAGEPVDHAPTAHAPYFVMERCSGGTLRAASVGDWPRLRSVLEAMLGALAHAHARDVVHLDLKPSNVLEGAISDERPGLKLIDFGLSWLARPSDDGALLAAGTPRTMAPEQILGRRRDLGPWTDLYALGCVAYELASGRAPFRGASSAEIVAGHLGATPPPLAARFPVPPGFEPWLLQLLGKEPQRRPACAADAARALARVDGATRASWVSVPGALAPSQDDDLTTQTEAPGQSGMFAARPAPSTRSPEAPEVSCSWAVVDVAAALEEDATSAIRLDRGATSGEMPAGLGLRLYALRAAPFIGRVQERRSLWRALERVGRERRAGAVVLTGAAGIGKTRLASWLAERAHELGAAKVLRASHDLVPHAGTGLPAVLARAARTAGLEVDAIEARLRAVTDGALGDADTRLLADVLLGGEARTTLSVEPLHRFGAMWRMLRALAGARPLLVVLDDDASDPEQAAFVAHVLSVQADESAPVLFVLTASSEATAEWPRLRAALAALARHDGAETIELEPLGRDDHARLVRSLLGLSGEVAARVEETTAGHPMFAIALVGALIDDGLLVPGDTGFRLVAGRMTELPRAVSEPWIDRVRRALDREPLAARRAVELAAAFGATVDEGEWRVACARAGADDGVLDRLIRVQLAHRAGSDDERSPTFALAHAIARDHVQREAEREGRWAAACLAVADVLEDRPRTAERDERRGRALLLGGRAAEAADVLLASATIRHDRGEIARALELLELAEAALRVSSAEADDERWGSLAALRAASWLRSGVPAEAEALLAAAIDDGRRCGWRRALPDLLWASSTLLGQRGRHAESAAQLGEALEGFLALGDVRGCNKTLRCLAHIDRQAGRLDEAEAHLRRALDLATAAADDESVGWSLQGLAAVAAARGQLDVAEDTVRRGLAALERSGNAFATAHARNTAGEIARRRGDLAAAEADYARAVELASSVGSFLRHVARLNHGLMLLERGRVPEAETQLLRCLRVAGEARMPLLEYGARAGLLVCAAREGSLGAIDEHLAALTALATGPREAETASWIARAADALRARGDAERAEAAERVARAFRGEA